MVLDISNIKEVVKFLLSTHLRFLHRCVEKRQYITGFAAEFSGARLCINVAMAILCCVFGMKP